MIESDLPNVGEHFARVAIELWGSGFNPYMPMGLALIVIVGHIQRLEFVSISISSLAFDRYEDITYRRFDSFASPIMVRCDVLVVYPQTVHVFKTRQEFTTLCTCDLHLP